MQSNGVKALAALCCAAVFVTGCAKSPIPLAENFERTSQHKVRSAGHWELVARDVVAQTSAFMENRGVTPGLAYYVAEPANASSFDKAFRQFLITEMVNSGLPVSQDSSAPIQVTYDTQVVRHDSHRPYFIPGQYTMLATGLLAAYGVSTAHVDLQRAAGVGLAIGADYAASVATGGPTNTELVLTTTLSSGGMYLARTTDVYYLENVDAGLFAKARPLPPTRSFEVVSE